MNKKTSLVMICLIGAIYGCVTPITNLSPAQISEKIKVEGNEFDAAITYTGPDILETRNNTGLFTSEHDRFCLRAFKSKATGHISYQLYANIWYSSGDWRFYRNAALPSGLQAKLTQIKSRPTCMANGGLLTCSHEEIVGLSIPEKYLQDQSSEGIKVRFDAKSGHKTYLVVPANYVQAFLAKVKQ